MSRGSFFFSPTPGREASPSTARRVFFLPGSVFVISWVFSVMCPFFSVVFLSGMGSALDVVVPPQVVLFSSSPSFLSVVSLCVYVVGVFH